MSVVTLQIGQCGNQSATSFFQTMAEECSAPSATRDLKSEALETFFRPRNVPGDLSQASTSYHARSVLIDMEPKVVQASIKHAKQLGSLWSFDESRSFSKQSGSGNNWAAGYCTHASNHLDTIMELVRKEAEHCDHLGGFFILQSLAGGTGSGMGTRVSEALRDHFASSFVFNTVVWPYKSGEVIVQSYNTALSMAHLLDVSDAVCVIENESLHATCVKSLGITRPSFTDMNQVIARALANAFLPSRRADLHRPLRMLSDLLEHVTPHPSYKVLSLRSVPQVPPKSMDFTTFKWDATIKRIRQMQMTGAATEEGLNWYMTPGRKGMNRTLAAHLTLRGPGASEADVASFRDPQLYASLNADPFRYSHHPAPFCRHETAASLVSNDQACVPYVEHVVSRAHGMLAARAYVYQYEREGLSVADFEAALLKLEDVIAKYGALG